jgi:hypothetical protein
MHGVAAPHVPVAVQAETPFAWHSVWPGAHVPVQTPPTHVWFTQATGAPHTPLSVQVCTPLFEHWIAPGAQTVHAPFQHTGVDPAHVVWLCQLPAALQIWVTLPEHCAWPAAHTPVQVPPTQVWLTQHAEPHAMPPSHVKAETSPGEESTLPASDTVPSLEASADPVSTAVWSASVSGAASLVLASQSPPAHAPSEKEPRPSTRPHAASALASRIAARARTTRTLVRIRAGLHADQLISAGAGLGRGARQRTSANTCVSLSNPPPP